MRKQIQLFDDREHKGVMLSASLDDINKASKIYLDKDQKKETKEEIKAREKK